MLSLQKGGHQVSYLSQEAFSTVLQSMAVSLYLSCVCVCPHRTGIQPADCLVALSTPKSPVSGVGEFGKDNYTTELNQQCRRLLPPR